MSNVGISRVSSIRLKLNTIFCSHLLTIDVANSTY